MGNLRGNSTDATAAGTNGVETPRTGTARSGDGMEDEGGGAAAAAAAARSGGLGGRRVGGGEEAAASSEGMEPDPAAILALFAWMLA